MTGADKTKLNGIATGANNYTHPTSYGAKTGVPTANATLTHGGTFTVTQPVTDAMGHVTALNTRTYTLPTDNNTTYSKGNGLLLSGTTFSADFGTGTDQVARGDHTHSTWTLLKKRGVAGDGRQMWLYVNEAIKMCTLYVSEVINSFPANSTHAIYPDTQWIPNGYIPKHPTIGSGSYSSIMIVGSDGKIVLRNGSQAQSSVQVWAHATWIY